MMNLNFLKSLMLLAAALLVLPGQGQSFFGRNKKASNSQKQTSSSSKANESLYYEIGIRKKSAGKHQLDNVMTLVVGEFKVHFPDGGNGADKALQKVSANYDASSDKGTVTVKGLYNSDEVEKLTTDLSRDIKASIAQNLSSHTDFNVVIAEQYNEMATQGANVHKLMGTETVAVYADAVIYGDIWIESRNTEAFNMVIEKLEELRVQGNSGFYSTNNKVAYPFETSTGTITINYEIVTLDPAKIVVSDTVSRSFTYDHFELSKLDWIYNAVLSGGQKLIMSKGGAAGMAAGLVAKPLFNQIRAKNRARIQTIRENKARLRSRFNNETKAIAPLSFADIFVKDMFPDEQESLGRMANELSREIASAVAPVDRIQWADINTKANIKAARHIGKGGFNDAVAILKDVINSDAKKSGDLYNYGLCLEALGNFEQAISMYNTAIEMNHKDHMAPLALARCIEALETKNWIDTHRSKVAETKESRKR
jgi:hypothetical protein